MNTQININDYKNSEMVDSKPSHLEDILEHVKHLNNMSSSINDKLTKILDKLEIFPAIPANDVKESNANYNQGLIPSLRWEARKLEQRLHSINDQLIKINDYV